MTTKTITLKASDGHEFAAYEAVPDGSIQGRVVVIQEIFGINAHIRDLCDRLAAQGIAAIAPGLFDRVEGNVELDYTPDGIARGLEIRGQIDWDAVMADTQAAVDHLASGGATGIVGYCWGGTIAWLAGCRFDNVKCAVGYYGGQIIQFIDETPKCPTMLHFGEKDSGIPMPDVQQITERHADVQVFTYPEADHGFHCDQRGSYHKESSDLADTRTNPFYAANLG